MEQKEFQEYFASDYKGADSLLKDILIPLFGGKFTEGYDTLTDNPDVKAKAAEANIDCIKHKGDLHALAYDVKVYDVTLNDNCKIAQSRQGIQNVIRQYIDSFEGAFIAFHYEDTKGRSWRLSFVEKMDKAKNSTSAKRYTYICGEGSPCRTIAERFYLLQNGEINSKTLLDAFSVEALSDEFFDKYKAIYANFVQYITGCRVVKKSGKWKNLPQHEPDETLYNAFERDDSRICDYIKKMMGRITFLYFLQRKGWLKNAAHPDGDPCFMQNLFKNSTYQDDFLDRVLEPLFYTILNTDKPQRKNAFIRHNKERNQEKEVEWDVELLKDWEQIPFLNGGLFERDENDIVRTVFPMQFFHNDDYLQDYINAIPTKSKNYTWERVPGLLDFFDQYNFTIDENDPDDAEVGIDPEMLGRIFENLLEDNKENGVYYTPKDVVQYMCSESLINYLQSNIKGHDDAIRKFVENPDIKEVPDSNAVLSALRNVKICDPAIGSGAFPMGLLKLLVNLRKKLGDEQNTADLKKEIVNNNIYGVDIKRGAVDIARLRFWLSIVVDEEDALALPNLDYKIMQGNSLIENYEGIDLSKLQQQVLQTKVYEPQRDLFGGMSKNQIKTTYTQADTSANLQNLLLQYYPETNHDNKTELKNRINEVVKKHILYNFDLRKNQAIRLQNEAEEAIAFNESKIADLRKQFPNKTLPASATAKYDKEIVKLRKQKNENVAAIKKYEKAMADLETLDLNGNEQLFLWHTWFADVFESGGFDIVIGNPPYIKEYTSKAAFDGFRNISPYYVGKMDLWHGFACHGLDLTKHEGHLCFIAQNNWTTNDGAKLMRNKICNDARIVQLLDFYDYMIFRPENIEGKQGNGADTQTMIMLFQNNAAPDNYKFDYRTIVDGSRNTTKSDVVDLLKFKKTDKNDIYEPKFKRERYLNKTFTFSKYDDLLDRFSKNKLFLQEDEVAQGIVFPQDFLDNDGAEKLNNKFAAGTGIFGLTTTELNSLNLHNNEKQLIRPYFTTEQIGRYYTCPQNEKWLIYTDSSFKKEDSMNEYPNIKKHLDNFVDIFTSDNKPYGLHRCRNEKFFKGEKIISLRKCVDRPCFSYSDFDCYVTQTFFSIKTTRWNVKYLTGLLNSKLIAFWLHERGKMQGSNYQVDKEPLMEIPLPMATLDEQQPIIDLVDKILSLKKMNNEKGVADCEREIDSLVYSLYGITKDEVKVIDKTVAV